MNHIKEVQYKFKNNIETVLVTFKLNENELPNELPEQIAFKTRSVGEGLMLIVVDNSTHEEILSQSLQTNIKQLESAVTFLTGHNSNLNVTNKKIKINFRPLFEGIHFIVRITPLVLLNWNV